MRTSYVPGMEYSAGNQIHIHRHVIQLDYITYPVHLGTIPIMLLLFVHFHRGLLLGGLESKRFAYDQRQ